MRRIVLLVVTSLMLVGCNSGPNLEKASLRETMYNGTNQIRQNEKAWAEKLVAYPPGTLDPRTGEPSDGKNKASEIKPLTPAQYDQHLKTHAEFEQLVDEDRARDIK